MCEAKSPTAPPHSRDYSRGTEHMPLGRHLGTLGQVSLSGVRGMSGIGGDLALDEVVNFEHFWLTGVDAELGENRHEACSERFELFL